MDHLTRNTTVTGILKGYDQLLNLVLDDVTEELQRKSCSSLKQPDRRR
jgi:small nuclear ribonucleoprotein (snRNP)-like protein